MDTEDKEQYECVDMDISDGFEMESSDEIDMDILDSIDKDIEMIAEAVSSYEENAVTDIENSSNECNKDSSVSLCSDETANLKRSIVSCEYDSEQSNSSNSDEVESAKSGRVSPPFNDNVNEKIVNQMADNISQYLRGAAFSGNAKTKSDGVRLYDKESFYSTVAHSNKINNDDNSKDSFYSKHRYKRQAEPFSATENKQVKLGAESDSSSKISQDSVLNDKEKNSLVECKNSRDERNEKPVHPVKNSSQFSKAKPPDLLNMQFKCRLCAPSPDTKPVTNHKLQIPFPNIYARRIPPRITEADISKALQKLGVQPQKIFLFHQNSGMSAGYGSILFPLLSDSIRFMKKCGGVLLLDCNCKIYLHYADVTDWLCSQCATLNSYTSENCSKCRMTKYLKFPDPVNKCDDSKKEHRSPSNKDGVGSSNSSHMEWKIHPVSPVSKEEEAANQISEVSPSRSDKSSDRSHVSTPVKRNADSQSNRVKIGSSQSIPLKDNRLSNECFEKGISFNTQKSIPSSIDSSKDDSSSSSLHSDSGSTFDLQKKYPPPDKSKFIYDRSIGFYLDPLTGLFYNEKSGYYFSVETHQVLSWDSEKCTYIEVVKSDKIKTAHQPKTQKREKNKHQDYNKSAKHDKADTAVKIKNLDKWQDAVQEAKSVMKKLKQWIRAFEQKNRSGAYDNQIVELQYLRDKVQTIAELAKAVLKNDIKNSPSAEAYLEKFRQHMLSSQHLLDKPQTPEPMSEDVLQEPVTEPVIQEHVTEPVIQGHVTEPVVQDHVTEPVVQDHVTEPVVQEHVTEPVVQDHVTEPVVQDHVTEPVVQDHVIEPVVQDHVTEPVVQEHVTEPVVQEHVTEPVIQECVTEPVKQETVNKPYVPELPQTEHSLSSDLREPLADDAVKLNDFAELSEEQKKFLDEKLLECRLCKRYFLRTELLYRHAQWSTLHRDNLKQWKLENAKEKLESLF